MQKLLVSIVIPTYGGRERLKDSLKSALAQTYNNIEIIVVDDNPPESENRRFTERLMSEFETDARVKYVKHPENRNGAAARNTGIKNSNGSFIAFLDDDDCFLPDKIAKQIDFLTINSDFQAVYCLASKDGEAIQSVPYEGNVSLELLMGKSNMFTPTLMFRRDILEELNGFDESYRRHQDYELLLRFFSAGHQIGCLKECLTDLGRNDGENSPHGEELEQLKQNFLQKFDKTMSTLDKSYPGAKKKIYATHYAKVFIDHIKTHRWRMAFHTLKSYWSYSPSIFMAQIYKTAKHIILD